MVLNDEMPNAVAEFVAAKDRFDVEGRAYIPGSWLHRIKRRVQGWTVPERGWTATFPSKFVERTIPFSEVFFRASKAQPMTIDSRMIVSGPSITTQTMSVLTRPSNGQWTGLMNMRVVNC